MTTVTAFCAKCKSKNTPMKNPTEVVLKNGRTAMKGECPKCGTSMMRFGSVKKGASRKSKTSRQSKKSRKSSKSRSNLKSK